MPAKNSTKRGQVEVLITRGKNGTPLSEPENKEDEQASDASEPNQGKVKAEPKKRGRKKKDTKAEGTGKGSARNLEGSGHAYASPCERCYLKELFCERPKLDNHGSKINEYYLYALVVEYFQCFEIRLPHVYIYRHGGDGATRASPLLLESLPRHAYQRRTYYTTVGIWCRGVIFGVVILAMAHKQHNNSD